MFTNPDLATQLAREHHRELLAQASQRRLRHQNRRPAPARITRILAAAIARAGSVAAQATGAMWPAGPRPLGEPAAQAQASDGSH
jgi:hypothetical protein